MSPVPSDMSIPKLPIQRQIVQMESEGIQTDPEEDFVPERKKQKRSGIVQTENEPRPDAETWLQMQHDKLMVKRYGPDYQRKRNREVALLKVSNSLGEI